MDPFTALAALLPLFTDIGKGVIGRWINPEAKPANVDEVIKLRSSDIDRLKALAELDKGEGGASQWVVNVRQLQRPVALLLVIGAWLASIIMQADDSVVRMTSDLASAGVFYLFGDRTLMYLKRG